MIRQPLVALGCAASILLLATNHALADNGPRPEDAQNHGEKAQVLYDVGHWDEAIAEYEAAYASGKDPIYLFKMGEACQRKGDAQRAIDLYKNFVEKAPDSPLKPEVDGKISALEIQLEAAKTPALPAAIPVTETQPIPSGSNRTSVATPPPNTTNASQPKSAVAPSKPQPADRTLATINSAWSSPALPGDSSTSGIRILGGVLMGVGIASLGVGGYFSWRTKNIESSINNATVYDPARYDSGKQAATLQWVFYGAGAGVTLTGMILYVARGKKSASRERVSFKPVVWSRIAGLTVQGAF